MRIVEKELLERIRNMAHKEYAERVRGEMPELPIMQMIDVRIKKVYEPFCRKPERGGIRLPNSDAPLD